MFIVDEERLIALHMDSKCKLKRINGDFQWIISHLKENITELTFDENHYLNFHDISKQFHPENNIIVYDTGKMRKIIVSNEVINEIGVSKTMELLFGYSFGIIKKIRLWSKLRIFWSMPIQETGFQIKRADTMKQLIRLCLTPHNKVKDSSWFITSHVKFSYALGHYSKNAYINNVSKGTDRNASLSEIKAISEAIERISCSIVNKNIRTFPRINNKVTDISEIYADRVELGQHTEIQSIWLDSVLAEDEKSSICIELLYYPYHWVLRSGISNSNGVATHISKKSAIEGWILELVERDAFMLAWLLKRNIHRIDATTLVHETKSSAINIMKVHKVELEFFIIKHDNPIPICLLLGGNWTWHIASLGSGKSIEEAIRKAIEEFSWTVGFFKRKKLASKDEILKHIHAYVDGTLAENLNWLWDLPKMTLTQVENFFPTTTFHEMLSSYRRNGISFYTFTYKNELNSIFHRYTVKSFSNALIPIWFWIWIPEAVKKSKRLMFWQKKLGIKSLNDSMHPFW